MKNKGHTLIELIIALTVCAILIITVMNGCEFKVKKNTASSRATKAVARQQDQYLKAQPIPAFDWSLERELLIRLYQVRNMKVATHSVWRSDYGLIEGDCPSMGYGIPYDSSLTNPLQATDIDNQGEEHNPGIDRSGSLVTIEQPEPNGIFASKNTAATWVMCTGDDGSIEPVYVESKVTVFPGNVNVDYQNNRVQREGKPTVTIPVKVAVKPADLLR